MSEGFDLGLFLQEARAEGQQDSEGNFTIAQDKALDKLAHFSLAGEYDWVLKVVQAVNAWEKAIAATVIHYINDVLADMDAAPYDFLKHAKHWGELKGFALSFQFNPHSKLSDAKFAEFHTKVGTKPALPGDANFEAYKTDLTDARTILKDAYEFADDDVTNW